MAASALLTAYVAIPVRVSSVALPIWGTTTHLHNLISDAHFSIYMVHVPGLLHQRVIRSDVWLSGDNIHPGCPNPPLTQSLRKCVRVHQCPTARIYQDCRLLHPLQERLIHQVLGLDATWREYEHDIALRRDGVNVDLAQGVELELGCEGRVALGVRAGRGGGIAGVHAMREAEWDESREGGLRNAAEAEEASSAHGRGFRRAQLGAAECEGVPVELGPLQPLYE